MNKITLKQVTEKEWKDVAILEKKSASKTFKAFNREDDVKKYIKNSQVFFIILDKEKIGTVSFEKEKNSIHFNGLTILKKYRKQGLGSKAIKKVLDKIKDKKKLYLVVHPENNSAIIVYLKSGFKIKEWKNNYFGDGEARLLLKLDD
jgi:ribosomal protein S18 acetylase RimI-like enzyme